MTPGSMGRALPGYRIALLDQQGLPAEEGEICIDLAGRPTGLMQGYLDDDSRNESIMQGGYYHTGDVAVRDPEGYLTYVGRMDDIFKSSDYRISPFELESVPDPVRLSLPKAYIVLAAGHPQDADPARSRRIDLRRAESLRAETDAAHHSNEFREEDFPSLKSSSRS